MAWYWENMKPASTGARFRPGITDADLVLGSTEACLELRAVGACLDAGCDDANQKSRNMGLGPGEWPGAGEQHALWLPDGGEKGENQEK